MGKMKTIRSSLENHLEHKGYRRLEQAAGGAPVFAAFDKTSLYLVRILMPEHGKAPEAADILGANPRIQADKVVLLDLHILEGSGSSQEAALRERAEEAPNLEAQAIHVHWLVDAPSETLHIPRRQPRSILGLDRELAKVLRQEGQSYYRLRRRVDRPVLTYVLIAMNLAYWLVLEWSGGSTDLGVLLRFGAMQRTLVLAEGEYWRLFTSMFMHIGIAHLAFNQFSLYIFGTRIEMYLSRVQYLGLYLVSGLAGGLLSLLANGWMGVEPVSAGASAAIYGILGSVMVVSKLSRRSLDGVNDHMVWIILLLGVVHAALNPEVDGYAHLGGFMSGVLFTLPAMSGSRLEHLPPEAPNSHEKD